MKIGLGITTYNRADYFKTCIESVQRYGLKDLHSVVVYNDGSTKMLDEYAEVYKGLDSKVHVEHCDTNKGISKAKNFLLNKLLEQDCKILILMEDDIEITSKDTVSEYASLIGKTGWHHFNFALHGPRNSGGPVCRTKNLLYYPNIIGAWSVYTKPCIDKIGFFDEEFRNAMEHVIHTKLIADVGMTAPFWYFPDHKRNSSLLKEQPGSFVASTNEGVASPNFTHALERIERVYGGLPPMIDQSQYVNMLNK